MARYLVPCSCGREVAVTTTQAGLEVRCDCGNLVHVPPLMKLKQLPIAPEVQATRGTAWTGKHSAILAGLLLLVVAIPLSRMAYFRIPPAEPVELLPSLEYYVAETNRMEPFQLVDIMRGFQGGMDESQPLHRQSYDTIVFVQRATFGVTIAAIIVGAVLFLGGLLWPNSAKS